MTRYFGISGKFAADAQKAFFSELSLRLEMMAEVLSLESKEEDFVEMIEILEALKTQANSHQCDKIVAEHAAKRAATSAEVKF